MRLSAISAAALAAHRDPASALRRPRPSDSRSSFDASSVRFSAMRMTMLSRLLDLRQKRPAMQRHDRGAVRLALKIRIAGRRDRLRVFEDDRRLRRRRSASARSPPARCVFPRSKQQIIEMIDALRALHESNAGRDVVDHHRLLRFLKQHVARKSVSVNDLAAADAPRRTRCRAARTPTLRRARSGGAGRRPRRAAISA